ncbi:hypothetical protein HDU76_011853, partial [Blyttiomyces sp. JEL0837]
MTSATSLKASSSSSISQWDRLPFEIKDYQILKWNEEPSISTPRIGNVYQSRSRTRYSTKPTFPPASSTTINSLNPGS